MLTLKNHTLVEKIWENTKGVIYRGYRNADHLRITAKLSKDDFPSARDIAQIEHEARILSEIDVPGVIKCFGVDQYDRGVALILEDMGGISISDLMAVKRLELRRALEIGAAIARALQDIHQSQIVHKDIKPQNVLCNLETGLVKVVDFGIASRLKRGTVQLTHPDAIEGTLAYMSPEQTGRMNRDIDCRTDLYSLGVTLYEMLTGMRPFMSADAVELVYSHIARVPTAPHELAPEIPKVVSDIVMKLLSKEAEHRYQSGHGLAADLDAVIQQIEEHGSVVSSFPLAREDVSDALRIPEKLYGREAQMEMLFGAFERATKGRAELVLLAGAGGVGKSSLVHEIHKPIAQHGGDFVSGKFDQLRREVPFAAFAEAFGDMIRRLLTELPKKLAEWKSKLLAALGPNAQIMIDLIPDLELIIGPQPPVAKLSPMEAQIRFGLVLQSFVRVFCSASRTLVLFLDDLQWADSASLLLLPLLLTDSRGGHLVIVGAYRDHEVDDAHPLRSVLQKLSEEGVEPLNILLPALGRASVRNLLADTFGESSRIEWLAGHVLNKTRGNPFFINQLLAAWHRAGLVRVDRALGRWTWDEAAVEAAPVAENVVDFMAERLRQFEPKTGHLLAIAACIGHEFDRRTLAITAQLPVTEVADSLWLALSEGLLIPLNADYRLLPRESQEDDKGARGTAQEDFNAVYKFLHDRVQQAAYSLISKEEAQDAHLRIARHLRARLEDRGRNDELFSMVNHYNAAAARLSERAECVDVARMNLKAGQMAKAAAAPLAAVVFLRAGFSLLSDKSWETDYDLMFSLHIERAECEYVAGQFDPAEETLAKLQQRARTDREHGEIYSLRMVLCSSRGFFVDGLNLGRAALKRVGIEVPQKSEEYWPAFVEEVRLIDQSLERSSFDALVEGPQDLDPDHDLYLRILEQCCNTSFGVEPTLTAVFSAKMVNFSLAHGHAPLSPVAYVWYGQFMAGLLGRHAESARWGHLALKVMEKLSGSEIVTRVNCLFGMFAPYSMPMRQAMVYLEKAQEAGLELRDIFYVSHAYYHSALSLLRIGHPLNKVRDEIERGVAVVQRTKDLISRTFLEAIVQVAKKLQGPGAPPAMLSAGAFDLEKKDWLQAIDAMGIPIIKEFYCAHQLQSLFWYGKCEEALLMATLVEQNLGAAPGHHWPMDLYFYGSLSLSSVYPTTSPADQPRLRERLDRYFKELCFLAESCPGNELHRKLLCAAEMARISGQESAAADLYEQAIAAARKNGFPHHEALACELGGQFHLERGHAVAGRAYLMLARQGYMAWGAAGKVEHLDQKYSQLDLRAPAPVFTATETDGTTTERGHSGLVQIDAAAMIRAAQAIAGEIALDRLMSRLMELVVGTAGAQQGTLLLKGDGSDKLSIAAEISVEGGTVILSPHGPIEASHMLSPAIVQYVARTQKALVLRNAASEGSFVDDAYVQAKKPRSVLCMPVVQHGVVRGILYLENNLLAAAFTDDRVQLLRVLCSQMAISIENASFYASLEQKVVERTRELEEAQARIVKLEKEATEVRMAGGFAHEMRNALTSAKLHIRATQTDGDSNLCIDNANLLTDMFMAIQPVLQDAEIEIVVSRLTTVSGNEQKLDKVLRAVEEAVSRALKITGLLLHYSRLGDERPGNDVVNVRELVESILSEVKADDASSSMFEASVKVDAERAIRAKSAHFDSILRQVIENARDAVMLRHDAAPKMITVEEEMGDESFTIRILDTGVGIPEQDRGLIFAPFFSTKPATGVGLGLGMVEKLVSLYEGKITFESEPGQGTLFRLTFPTTLLVA